MKMPALLTRVSTRPNRPVAASTIVGSGTGLGHVDGHCQHVGVVRSSDRSGGGNNSVAKLAVSGNQSGTDTSRSSCDDGDLVRVIHGNAPFVCGAHRCNDRGPVMHPLATTDLL